MKNLLVLIVKKRDKAQKLLRKNLKISIVLLALAGGILIRLLREDNEVLRFYAPHGTVFIELARTEQERELGLMNRQSLGSEDGMLFVFDENDAGCFWMKNTYIALDMIWLNSDKKVTFVHHNAKPQSEESICPDSTATFVLELNAGVANQLGLTVGAQARF